MEKRSSEKRIRVAVSRSIWPPKSTMDMEKSRMEMSHVQKASLQKDHKTEQKTSGLEYLLWVSSPYPNGEIKPWATYSSWLCFSRSLDSLT